MQDCFKNRARNQPEIKNRQRPLQEPLPFYQGFAKCKKSLLFYIDAGRGTDVSTLLKKIRALFCDKALIDTVNRY